MTSNKRLLNSIVNETAMLNLEWFRTFKVIYEVGSQSAAAQILFISQPGVCLHLNSLEAYMGLPLFERDSRRMIPTDKGTKLYHSIVDAMAKLEETEHLFRRRSKQEKATIGIGIHFETFQYALEAHIPQLPFNLVTHFGEYQHMLQDLYNSTLDLILTPHNGTQRNLEFTPVIKERLILVCGNHTKTEKLSRILSEGDKDELNNWLSEQIWYTTGDKEYLKKFWAHHFKMEPSFQPNYVLPYFSSVLRSLRNGDGFAVIPEILCEKDLADGAIQYAWMEESPPEYILYFGKRKNSFYTKELRQLEDILTTSLANYSIAASNIS